MKGKVGTKTLYRQSHISNETYLYSDFFFLKKVIFISKILLLIQYMYQIESSYRFKSVHKNYYKVWGNLNINSRIKDTTNISQRKTNFVKNKLSS